jgi:hypothetical protein
MKLRTKIALGIDIGARRISVALVERDEQGFRTVAAASGDLPAGQSNPREGTNPQSRRTAIARLLSQLGRRSQVRRAPAAVALAADSMVLQLLDLPKHVPTNIGEFVRSELQQYVALSGKTIISDFCGVGPGVQKRLLAVAADMDEIQEKVKACGAAHIAVDVVEPSLLAYARAFLTRQNQTGRDGDVMIAMLGPRTLTVALFLRGTLDFVRVRNLPGDADTPPLLCAWLAEELKAVVRYYDAQAPRAERHWQTCLVIDDGAHRAGEIEALLAAEGTRAPIAVVEAREALPGSPSTQEGEVSTAAVGAALALLGTAGDGLKINLLPKTVTQARSLSTHVLATALAGVLIFLGLFATAGLLERTTGAMDRRIEQIRLSEELYTTPALMVKEKFLDQDIARLRHRLAPLRKAVADRHGLDWPGILAAVRQAAPADVAITQWHCDDGKTLLLKGLAPSCPAAQTLVRNLESQKPFASASLSLVQRQPDPGGRLEYRIDCLLKGPLSATSRVGEPPTKGGESS